MVSNEFTGCDRLDLIVALCLVLRCAVVAVDVFCPIHSAPRNDLVDQSTALTLHLSHHQQRNVGARFGIFFW
jgi:hypothetical protein